MAEEKKQNIEGFNASESYPEYYKLAGDWQFFLDTYESSVSDYVDKYLIRNSREGEDEFNSRKELAYRENHCKQIVNLFNSYLFKDKPSRITNNSNAEKYWKEFEQDVDGHGTNIDAFMRVVDKYSSVLGRVYIVMDRKLDPELQTGTHKDNLISQHYMYMVKPSDVLKVAFDEYGNVKWAVIREIYFDDDNPFDTDTMTQKIRYRLWTTTEWYLFYDDAERPNENGSHGVGVCPVFPFDNAVKNDRYDGLSLINEAAYIDKSIFNNISRLNTIIDDQTFSQLVMPVEAFVFQDEDAQEDVLTLSSKRVLMFSSAGGKMAKPDYISPDASQAKLVLDVIKQQISQLYNSLGLQSETSDTSGESGSAKEYDYSRLNSYLTSKAERLEELERKIVLALSSWMDTELEVEIIYPENFDVKTLSSEILHAQELSLLKISDTFQKELYKRIVEKALPKASEETMRAINKEIEDSNPLDPDGLIEIEKEMALVNIDATEEQIKQTSSIDTTSDVAKAKKKDNGNKNHEDRMKAGDRGGKLDQQQNKITNL